MKLGSVIALFTGILLLASTGYTQVPFTLDSTNVTGTATINLQPGVVYTGVKFTVTGANYNDEAQMFIGNDSSNGSNLFPGANGGNENTEVEIVVSFTNAQLGLLQDGNNTIRIEYNAGKYNPQSTNAAFTDEFIAVTDIQPIEEAAKKSYAQIQANIDTPITPARSRALEIYKRLVGVTTPIDNPILIAMEQQIASGNPRAAAALATEESGFYNLVVRDFAARMSTREETINEPLNDFIATFIGITRDDRDARELLYGDYFYMSDSLAVRSNIENDILKSNNHYNDIVNNNFDLKETLVRTNGQFYVPGNDGTAPHPDAAGVITTRAFMGAHAIDGTNRRLVEYTFKQFTCNDMEDWADAKASDVRVGRDIDRAPGGEGPKYLSTCKACHTVMDGFRGAFAYYDFDRGFTRYRPGQVDRKMNQNNNVFPGGYVTTDNSWINNATGPSNTARFGWRGVANAGNGVRQMGRAVANTRAFSKCMVKKVYREVCRRSVATFENDMVESVASQFEASGYRLKGLFETIAVRPECIGVN